MLEVGARLKTRDDGIALQIGVVDVEAAVLTEARMEGQAEQALLVALRSDAARDIQEGFRKQLSLFDDSNAAGLLDHKQTPVAGLLQVDRTLKA